MTAQRLEAAAAALAGVLEAENDALSALDIPAATALLPRKQRSLADFAASRPAVDRDAGAAAQCRASLDRLAAAGARNRLLLQRAITVQGQVIATLLRAVPAVPTGSGYRPLGARSRGSAPLALSARA